MKVSQGTEREGPAHAEGPGLTRGTALRFVVLLGFVSLLADVTYEGARSLTGPFLATLGASGLAVGLVSGLGELIGYTLRLASGIVADRTRQYWGLTFLGYAVNLVAVPLLALAGRWEVAAALIVAERTGKAIRSPARDAMLSHAVHRVGVGWGFGLHEAMDQIGAVLGPLAVATALALGRGYRGAFGMLLVPALMALGVLATAWRLNPRPRDFETEPEAHPIPGRPLPRGFWIYLAAASAIAAGFADFPLIAYHLQRGRVIPPESIPLLYAMAMGVDAVAALVFGRMFDRWGLRVLVLAAALTAPFSLLAFGGGAAGAISGMVLWAVGMGAQESILRAAVAKMVPPDRRGTAYGLFNAGIGLAWFLGSALMGWLYDTSLAGLIAFSASAQLLSIPLLLASSGRLPGGAGRRPESSP
jgi:predicted MFS family arabinose efflux permease